MTEQDIKQEHSHRGKPVDPRRDVAGACEEAAAALGGAVALGTGLSEDVVRLLVRVQNDLVDVGADLRLPSGSEPSAVRLDEGYVQRVEHACDHFDVVLPDSSNLVVPGGTPIAAALHQARTVVDRAERVAEAAGDVVSALALTYLDHLRQLLLILARGANVEHGDTIWQPGLSGSLGGAELWEPAPESERGG
ncbi:MAG: ATP:cob(I)alamin adenosyltransferase [Nocardioidaceae bacterium]